MSKPLPYQWLPGADAENSLAQQAQANFDALATGDGTNPLLIAAAQRRKVNFGTAVLSWNGVANTTQVTITHGVGPSPWVWAIGTTHFLVPRVMSTGATTAVLEMVTFNLAVPPVSSEDIYWQAIG